MFNFQLPIDPNALMKMCPARKKFGNEFLFHYPKTSRDFSEPQSKLLELLSCSTLPQQMWVSILSMRHDSQVWSTSTYFPLNARAMS